MFLRLEYPLKLLVEYWSYRNYRSRLFRFLESDTAAPGNDLIYLLITGSPNGPVLLCSLASVVVLCNAAGGSGV